MCKYYEGDDYLLSSQFCKKKMYTCDNLVEHYLDHGKSKPYSCFLCETRFSKFEAYIEHNYDSHSINPEWTIKIEKHLTRKIEKILDDDANK